MKFNKLVNYIQSLIKLAGKKNWKMQPQLIDLTSVATSVVQIWFFTRIKFLFETNELQFFFTDSLPMAA